MSVGSVSGNYFIFFFGILKFGCIFAVSQLTYRHC
uniref:Uncharacterized protein n=1 Tax=Siphoviridae sp. cttma3 TaxID=2825708 RepID=A0A8S5V8J0_9CAUD|nr:MAG TPA: hypothetical protein [Siphoviridae sp. cttma3]